MGFGAKLAPAGVLDALIDRQDADVARAAEPPVVVERLQVSQYLRVAVGLDEHALDEVRPGQVQARCVERLALVVQQALGLVAE